MGSWDRGILKMGLFPQLYTRLIEEYSMFAQTSYIPLVGLELVGE